MVRRVTVLALAAAMVSTTVGCRTRCGGGWFTSRLHGDSPCRLVGRPADGCCEEVAGVPVSVGGPAMPGTLVPGAGVPLLPGATGPAPELPFPNPSDLIPRAGVPVPPAVPVPAPGEMGNVLPPPKFGVPVKGGK